MADDPTTRFAALVERPDADVPLDEAAMVVAAHALPGLDVAAQLARLDELAAGVTEWSADGVVDHLVGRLGFRGDTETYHDAANSLLPLVLDRRLGIPLSLAVIAIEVGRRVGVPLVGVGMPGHFLLRDAADPDRHLDLFHGGTVLDGDGCRDLFRRLHPGTPWDDRFLAPVGSRAILARMLANLATAYRRVGDREGLCWAVGLRLHLPGATDRDRRELAVLLGASGRYRAAADVLEATGSQEDAETALRLRARLN